MDYPTEGPRPVEEDEAEIERQRSLLVRAADNVNSLRRELERWERIGRAAGAALSELEVVRDVPAIDPGTFRLPEAPGQTY